MNVSVLVSTETWGGAEIHTTQLSKTLAARGHRVKIVELGGDQYTHSLRQYVDSVEFVSLRRSKALQTIGWIEIYRVLHRLPRDIGIFVKNHFGAGNWKLDLAARVWFRRYITIEHMCSPLMPSRTSRRYLGGLVPGVGLWWFRQFIQHWARSIGPHLLITVSDAVRQRLINAYLYPARKIVTVYGGIDTTKFTPNSQFRNDWRAARGFSKDTFVFGAVGRLHEVKGYSIAIELFSSLARSMPHRDIRLVLVGDGPLQKELKEAAIASGFGHKIIFESFTYEPWRVYPGFDTFLMPSTTEALGMALLEAMACGCPPIAMGVDGILEVITHPDTGWVVPEGDRQGFLAAMRSAVQSTSQKLTDMGLKARNRVVDNFDAKATFARLTDLVEFGTEDGSRRMAQKNRVVQLKR